MLILIHPNGDQVVSGKEIFGENLDDGVRTEIKVLADEPPCGRLP
jgi:hypothetical protein